MSILSWNCHGLANPRTVRLLLDIDQQYRPSLIFLSETLVKHDTVQKVTKQLGFAGCYAIDVQGHSGGIALLWRNDGAVHITNSCRNFIDFEVSNEQLGRWRYTGYYGFPERARRMEAWNMLRELSVASELPWCILGDFNDIVSLEEKRGGKQQPRRLMEGFWDAIMDSGLHDLGFTGDIFTWDRSRGTDKWVQERLDRGMLHRKVFEKRRRRFKFENIWIGERECRDIVQECWRQDGERDLMEKIMSCSLKLEEWSGGLIREMKVQIGKYRKEMQHYRSTRDTFEIQKYDAARWQFMRLLEKQEIFWRQRAKQFWLREGDRNSSFFHKYATTRKEHNKIKKLKDKHGEWKEENAEIQEVITEYFTELFSSVKDSMRLSPRIKFPVISDIQKEKLVTPIADEEVKAAVFAMHSDKSPGIDSLNPGFYQTYWEIVGQDVIKFCREFFQNGELPSGLNRTLVCLIPKVKHPKKVVDLRPISLCNMLMKILSKVMANRLTPTLNAIISEKQSAFIEGRLLTDNALIAYEVNHYIRRKTQGKVGVAGLKVDISKAYDRLEWSFIEEMLQRFDFPTLWVDRVMNCVKSVSYSFLRDGDVFGEIIPQRGVRQGDPISPFLYTRGLWFIARMYEALSCQIINYEKSEVGPNTNEEDMMEVCEILGVRQVQKPGKYLRMPMNMGSSKTEVFGFLIDRVQQRLKGWYGKDVSRAGKITLLSSAAQTIPSFWMNLFLIPVTICEEV
ncbi:uncharacterized protein LOC141701117 [Apium graveolens]|uniref:uncharacterized protein LOC141701117 n=1 Tax=Apium graveolens TaxID=4045 RepID=UPI003D7BEF50